MTSGHAERLRDDLTAWHAEALERPLWMVPDP